MYKDPFSELLAEAHNQGYKDAEDGYAPDAQAAWQIHEEWARDVTEQHIENMNEKGGKPESFFDELAMTREAFVDSYDDGYWTAEEAALYA